MLIILIDLIRV